MVAAHAVPPLARCVALQHLRMADQALHRSSQTWHDESLTSKWTPTLLAGPWQQKGVPGVLQGLVADARMCVVSS